MPLWGRNDQAVTANSTTTVETSNGAPIGTYTAVKLGGGANAHFGNTSPGSRANVDVRMFNNTTPSAFLSGQAVGVFGVDRTEIAVSNSYGIAHAGWNLRRAGTGPIVLVGYTGTATGYHNTDVITVSSPVAGGNATATVSTNSSGGALNITITAAGLGFTVVNATANVSIANSSGGSSNGSGATFNATAGGRAGRVHYETLVAMGSLGAQTAAFGTPALVADASDDTILPDS
jgi:filamentous hemagglutinin